MTTLLIHHLEPMWDTGYKRYDTSFEKLEKQVGRFVKKTRHAYESVILTQFARIPVNDLDYPTLCRFVDDIHEYGYGWDKELANDSPDEKFVEGGYHSELVWIPEWLTEFANKEVTLIGAFIGECLEDMEIALKHVGAKVELYRPLCVG